ncbi:hypothetical protein [Mannheimia massilioguelmaensis]|uniref:hypothetical protein n=1 Tax=Mannheimia massilioguelmaensis TaxID=1604354 RepID=UPI0005CAD92E|nr:hypothetical protein [Mannheimia massilioguelmaensis]
MSINFLTAVKQFHKDKQEPNSRYLSWEYCYTAFYQARKTKNPDYDYLSLQLYQYLASWGMLRGSSFLLWKDYKIHIPVIKEMLKPEYDCLQGASCQNFLNEKILVAWKKLDDWLIAYYSKVRDSVRDSVKQDISTVLRSKILLGTLGCTPAYDRFFKEKVRAYGISSIYGKNSFKQLAEFYEKHHSEFEVCRQTLKVDNSDLIYPQMKLLDMGFWQLGFNEQNIE